uniref:C2 domain-containing protein n=1 Tax=Steinernema glaseri TaxID=37863 RepID=A0A1I8ALY8_9BILA
MNNNPSDWTSADEVSSFCHTPQTPGSPSSLTSFNTCKEPLLHNSRSTQLSNGAPSTTTSAFSFFQRFVGGGAKTSTMAAATVPTRVVKTNGLSTNGQMFFDEHDDQEIDNRSVIHYELGFYEKTLTSCFRGTLTFELRYDFIHRVLMVYVLRANHLPAVEKNRSSDPYVKMYLLPERRNHCKTRIFKKSLDPEFNEMFSFDVAYNNLPNRMLQFTVYDFDRFTRHGLVGNVIMRDLFEKSDLHSWTEYTMQIVGSQEKNDFGDLLLHLSYSPTEQKLFVTVSKAYNLRPMDITGASDPYVRISQIYQRRRVKMRKTSIKRANLNPVYHETIEFDLPPSQIDETNLLVQVMDWDR